jgi:hypothetical protein
MGALIRIAERLGIELAQLVLLLVLLFAGLALAANKFGSNPIGRIASWLEANAQPHA